MVLVSTDWVFDGTQGPAAEDDPPSPVNPYGFLKAASELGAASRDAVRDLELRVAQIEHRLRLLERDD